jgi:hypothetical protein
MGTEADEARKRRPSRSMVGGESVDDIAATEHSRALATTVALYFIDNGSWGEALSTGPCSCAERYFGITLNQNVKAALR